MTRKILRVTNPDKCIGCELCAFVANRLCGRVGISGSPVKILGKDKPFKIHLDPSVNDLEIDKIAGICPKDCFSVDDTEDLSELEYMLEGESNGD
ncbi:MAG: hypothetical protein AAB443_03360 [Patescibacteria group bacterium]